MESQEFLTSQIITYLGNKRALINYIGDVVKIVKQELNKSKLDTFDVFSGSGIVARFLKQHSNILYCNDLEGYSKTINSCYLTNKEDVNQEELDYWFNYIKNRLKEKDLKDDGFIRKLYAPKDDKNIQEKERVFYTTRNAKYIDTARQLLETIPVPYKTYFLANLIYEASTKNNTSGVFKGFYKNSKTNRGQFGGNGKNALNRITADIKINKPIFSNYSCKTYIYQGDSNEICKIIPHVDLAYIDPPYNQHPYGSNYFMLNLINEYKEPKEISCVSGIPTNWNKSNYNKKNMALKTLYDLCKNIKATYVLISFNSEGFVSFDEMIHMLETLGNVRTFNQNYNVFRGCRNLQNRDIHVTEYLFLLKKGV